MSSRNAGSLLVLFKNTKFIVANVMALVVLVFALVSGDGKKMVLNAYEKITGQKFETYSAIDDFSNETYFILKDKILRDKHISIENTDVSIFNASDTLHRYRVVLKEELLFYKVEKNSNGTWQIQQEK